MLSYLEKKDSSGNFLLSRKTSQIVEPMISVIMGVYNSSSTVASSINSILQQTYQDFELIVVNDGSTDASLDIIESYAEIDQRIVVVNQRNIGLTKSLNRSIKLSRGKYIARQDADDTSLLQRLQVQLSALENSQDEFNFCVTRYLLNNRSLPQVAFVKKFNIESLAYGNIICHGTFFGLGDIFRKNLYDESYRYAQDVEFILRCRRQLRILFITDVLYHYSSNAEQISKKHKIEQKLLYEKAVRVHLRKKITSSSYVRRITRNIYYYFIAP